MCACVPGWVDGGWKGVCVCAWVGGKAGCGCASGLFIFSLYVAIYIGRKNKTKPDKVITLSINLLPFDDHLLIELYLLRAPPGFLCHCIVRLCETRRTCVCVTVRHRLHESVCSTDV